MLMWPSRHLASAAALLALLVSSCQKDDIRTYQASKEKSEAAGNVQTPQAGGMETLSWTLPAGWTDLPGEGMRYATLQIQPQSGGDPLEVRVTPLSLAAQDPLANVNRWREQIGLDHVTQEQLADVARPVEIDGREAHLVDMTGPAAEDHPAQRILAAILPGDERAWFFLVMDSVERVAPVAPEFATFMQSVSVQQASMASLPAGHPPVGGGDASMEGAPMIGQPSDTAAPLPLQWTTPEGWSERNESNPSRLATLDVADGEQRAEVSITRFPGDVGGLLPNVNRWRGQLGLAPVQDLAALEHPLEEVQVDGSASQLLDLVGESSSGSDAQRMLVVLVPHEGFTYFIKMTGPKTLLDLQRDTFVQFARSVRFERPHS